MILLADLDLELLRDYRKAGIWGPVCRRPAIYGPLVSADSQAFATGWVRDAAFS